MRSSGMFAFSEARRIVRFAAEARRFLRERLTNDEALQVLRQRLATREQAFLRVMDDAIYARPGCPYARLLRHAGFESADVKELVTSVGLEGALNALYDAGVYVSLEELKGRVPIRRGSLEFTVAPSDFDNPFMSGGGIGLASSGSTGAPASATVDFGYVLNEALYVPLLMGAHDLWEHPVGRIAGPNLIPALAFAKVGKPLHRFFSNLNLNWREEKLRSITYGKIASFALGVAAGHLFDPSFSRHDQSLTAARWLADQTARGRPALMYGFTSPISRVCLLAKERGLDIHGTVFLVVGEPLTKGKADVIASVGSTAIGSYLSVETGPIALGCASPTAVDDLHFYSERLALIQRDKPTTSGTVNALIYTTLHGGTPRLLLNVESGDYASVTERNCGCFMGSLGLTTHLSEIRSYEKLTTEGATFIGSRLYELLEQVLPGRFGGHTGDYQLLEEEEDDSGRTRVSIVVSPNVGPVDEAAILENVKKFLSSSDAGNEFMAELWAQSGTLRVIRRQPYETRTSKVLPLHIIRRPPAAGEVLARPNSP